MSRRKEIQLAWSRTKKKLSLLAPKTTEHVADQVILTLATLKSTAIRYSAEENKIHRAAINWLCEHGDPIAKNTLCRFENKSVLNDSLEELVRNFSRTRCLDHEILMHWIRDLDRQKSRGVVYTPRALARFVARSAILQLKRIGCSPSDVRILEPAVGTGVFVTSLIEEFNIDQSGCPIFNFGQQEHISADRSEIPISGQSGNFSILQNLTCIDLSPAAIVIAQYLLVRDMMARNYTPDPRQYPLFAAGNSLNCIADKIYHDLKIESPDFYQITRAQGYECVLGNPPFGTLTGPTSPWVSALLHGEIESPGGQRSYFEVAGQKLGERKSWLHDDYVKFIRYAQWQAEKNQVGCIALVLNSGFISNLSFRGVRYHLHDCFDQLEIVNFGGDQRNFRSSGDENVFAIETGIATLVGTRSNSKTVKENNYLRLNGLRETKLQWCLNPQPEASATLSVCQQRIAIHPPNYRFDRLAPDIPDVFDLGWSLEDLFLSKWSAPVTARDHLVIHWNPKLLEDKIQQFLDPEKSTEEIREDFFPPPRSNRYPRGDSRSWKLEEVRHRLGHAKWRQWIRPCAYRPFDYRQVLWHPMMIDWPRKGLVDSLGLPGNTCLITRRQAPETDHYSYFWTTRVLPIDGIIRSDNRGNEYCFPLFQLKNGKKTDNINPEIISFLQRQWKSQAITAQSIFELIVAVLNSSEYRQRFSRPLCEQFPRVFFPKDRELALKLANHGRHIIDLQTSGVSIDQQVSAQSDLSVYKDPCEISFADNRLSWGRLEQLELNEKIWNYQVGSHQVLKKYCQYRTRARFLGGLKKDLKSITRQIQQLLDLTEDLDRLIKSSGGFDNSFDLKGKPNALANKSPSSAIPVSGR